ncbi:hypothetical protein MICAG_290009 [Microcystis aeruginosa PCC 9808]|uniref:Uncharacterized protein n=1 Tax=Microcystis aeruginosa PCC 9808 TaxID=1160284 RepID=I4HUU8_MICAE|nr:hypothetical protein MICAG_290009 [Microcystis aeruginosa PCC 9808]
MEVGVWGVGFWGFGVLVEISLSPHFPISLPLTPIKQTLQGQNNCGTLLWKSLAPTKIHP